MTTTIDDDLVVAGAISAANFKFGAVAIDVTANEVSSAEVTGLNLQGTGQVSVLLTADTPYPWSRVQEVGNLFNSQDGFTVYILRTNDVDTSVHYLAWQDGFS